MIKQQANFFRQTVMATSVKAAMIGAAVVGMTPMLANAQALEEIIVTAQKRTESLQDVPLSVQALSGEEMRNSGVGSLSVLEQISPSVTVNDATSYTLATVRGVGSTNQGGGNYTSVAIYVDEVYVPRSLSGSFSFANVEQLQVLKGPQGALYGRNATGGAIVVTTKTPRPGDEFSGSVSAGVGNESLRELGLSLSGGLGDNFAASLDLYALENDGFLEVTTPGRDDLDSTDTFAANAKLAFTPTDNTAFELSLWYDEADDSNGFGFQQVGLGPNPAFGGLNGPQALLAGFLGPQLDAALGFPNGTILAAQGAATITFETEFGVVADNEINGFTAGPAFLGGEDTEGTFLTREDFRGSLKGTFSFNAFDLVSITSVSTHENLAAVEILGATPGAVTTAFPFLGGDNLGFSAIFESDTISQEIRLLSTSESSIEWLAGAYYFADEGDALINADTFGASFRQATNEFEVDSLEIFVRAKFPIGDAFNLTVGARYTDEEYKLTDLIGGSTGLGDVDGPIFDGITLPGLPSVQQINAVAPGTFPESQDFTETTGGITLDWSNDSMLVYGSVNTGFKSGNLNANNPLSGGVDPEEIIAYELGFKSDLANDRFRLNGSVFFYDYENIHIQAVNQNSGSTILINGSNAEITGAELEFLGAISEGLTFSAALTVLDTEYKDDVIVPGGNPLTGADQAVPITGNEVAGAPETALTVGLDYIVPLGSGELAINANALLSDGYFFEAENRIGSGGEGKDSYTTLNANITYRLDHFSVSLWGTNITDEEYFRAGIVANGLIETNVAARPAQYGLRVGYEF